MNIQETLLAILADQGPMPVEQLHAEGGRQRLPLGLGLTAMNNSLSALRRMKKVAAVYCLTHDDGTPSLLNPMASAALDNAYTERSALLAWITCMSYVPPAIMAPAKDVDDPGWWLLYINTPEGQLSWHISPKDSWMFDHVQKVESDNPQAKWDGHTTDEKYTRIRRIGRLLLANREQ